MILAVVNPYFRTEANLENILLQASFAGIGAAGMTVLIVGGAFDLSVAGLLGLCGVLICRMLPSFGVLLTLVAGLILGLVLGGLEWARGGTKLKIPAFIATLGMMNIYLALAFIFTQAAAFSTVTDENFTILGTGVGAGVSTNALPSNGRNISNRLCNSKVERFRSLPPSRWKQRNRGTGWVCRLISSG